MRGKKLLVAFLLGVGLCFVPVLGHGEVKKWVTQVNMDSALLKTRVSYIMNNPSSFLYVDFAYDPDRRLGKIWLKLAEGVDTNGKILVPVRDNRDLFSYKSGIGLLDELEGILEALFSYIEVVSTDMDTDIVAEFVTKHGIPLGYFYQGKYYLWEK
jgi:hypothetical protein